MDYKKIFSPETIKKLDKKSNDNLKQMLGDKSLVQTLQSSQKLLAEIAKAEAPYKDKLEKLAVNMVKELYPIIDEEGIVLDAKLVGMSDVGKELDEIKVNNPNLPNYKKAAFLFIDELKSDDGGNAVDKEFYNNLINKVKNSTSKEEIYNHFWKDFYFEDDTDGLEDCKEFIENKVKDFNKINESISPEGRRRVINAITQGSALRGAFAFYLFKEHLDEIDPSLVEKYNQIMKEVFGIYDDPNAVAMMLSMLAQGHKVAGGSSKVIVKEIKVNNPNKTIEDIIHLIRNYKIRDYVGILMGNNVDMLHIFSEDAYSDLNQSQLNVLYSNLKKNIVGSINESEKSGITIKARAICFPMLVHELIKGLYELISLQGFKGDKAANQAVVNKVDKLEHEPSDIKYGKFVYDALNNIFAASDYNDSRIREFFFIDVYKLDDNEFISFIENAINESLTSEEKKWVEDTLRDIDRDIKSDEFDASGIDEIKVNNPSLFYKQVQDYITQNLPPYKKNDEKLFKYYNVLKKYGSEGNAFTFIKKLPKDKLIKFYNDLRKTWEGLETPKPLNEYSEKTINSTIERWKKENPKVDDNIAKQVIQRFDQIKNGLSQKLNIVVLPDELKQNNNYLNIDKYSFDDMVKLIRSLPENPDKIKKDAINKFVDKETIDRTMAQSYVARFMAKRDALKQGVESGIEELDLKAEDIKKLIPKFLLQNGAFLDPRNWKWEPFEQMLDALFPSQKQGEVTNDVTTDADKVYDKGGIEIYKGDDVHKCISYNPANIKKGDTKYGWCVTSPGNVNYDNYRFEERAPTFYFVFDRNKTSEPGHSPFKDKWHAIVIQVNADAKSYRVTSANNDADHRADSWEAISKIVPSETWSRIKDLKDYFKPIKLSSVERGRKFASGKNLSLAEFKELTQDEKILYIQGKASKNQIGKDILKILPEYKIDFEGRSTTLANVAIDSGQKFSYDDLKKNEPLAKRYAVFRFRHTDYSKDPLPLPFIKFLDEPGKEKYLKIFEENLNFDLIEKFFGEKAAETYVNNEVKNLQYVPPKAVKYIKDAKTKQLYSIYHKLTESWNFSDNFKLDEESISKLTDMPVQDVTPVPINQEQWSKLSNEERKVIVNLAGKVNGNSKYSTLLYALPYIVKDGEKTYALLPKDNKDFTYDKWTLVDLNGKVVKDNISGDATLGDNTLITGYPSDNEKINRIYSIKDLKGADKKLKEIKVNNPVPEFYKKLNHEEIQSLNKLKQHFKDVKLYTPSMGPLAGDDLIGFTTKNGYNINFIKRTEENFKERNPGSDNPIYKREEGWGFLLGGSQKFEGSLKKLVYYSINNYKPTNIKENNQFNIPNPDYYQKLLNMSNGISPSTAKYFQDVINSVKKQNGKATEKQWRILQRIKTGEFNLSTKN